MMAATGYDIGFPVPCMHILKGMTSCLMTSKFLQCYVNKLINPLINKSCLIKFCFNY